MVPETRTKTCKVTVCTPVWKEVEQQYTVMVPHQEKRQGVRKVCKMEQVKETRTVCKDKGHWEDKWWKSLRRAPRSARALVRPPACRLWARRSAAAPPPAPPHAAPLATAVAIRAAEPAVQHRPVRQEGLGPEHCPGAG